MSFQPIGPVLFPWQRLTSVLVVSARPVGLQIMFHEGLYFGCYIIQRKL